MRPDGTDRSEVVPPVGPSPFHHSVGDGTTEALADALDLEQAAGGDQAARLS